MKINETQKFFEQYDLDVEHLSFGVGKGEEEKERKFTLRIFFPKGPIIENFMSRLCYMEQRARGEEQAFFRWATRMLKLYFLFPPKEHVRERQFCLQTRAYPKKYSEMFEHIFKEESTTDMSSIGRMKYVRDDKGTEKLLRKAIFVKPDLEVPLSLKNYVKFRDTILDEMDGIEKWMDTEIKKRAGLRKKDVGAQEEIVKRKKKAFQILFKEARDLEEETAKKYRSVTEKAKDLYEKYEPLALKGPEYLRKQFNVSEFNSLLEEVIRLYEAKTKNDIKIKPTKNAVLVNGRPIENLSMINRQILLHLQHAKLTDNVKEKWDTLVWILQNLISRTECVTLIQLEAESVFLGSIDYLMKEIYRKIRQELTPPERRLFALMWFRYYPVLGNSPRYPFLARICAIDPVINGFFNGVDDRTRCLVLLVLAYRIKTWENQNLKRELSWRWKAYLNLYPYWLEVIRMDEREDKKEERLSRRCISLYSSYGDDNPNGISLIEKIPNISPDQWFRPEGIPLIKKNSYISPDQLRLYEEIFDTKDTKDVELPSLIDKYCTKRQAEILKMKFIGEGMTEQKIADRIGIRQPTVSEHIAAGVQKIQRGLEEEGLL